MRLCKCGVPICNKYTDDEIKLLAGKIVWELNAKGAGLGSVSNMIVEQVLIDAEEKEKENE